MKLCLHILLCLVLLLGSNSRADSKVYIGIDENQQECRVNVNTLDKGNGQGWITMSLQAESGTLDTSLRTPVMQTQKKGSECNPIAQYAEDSISITEGNIVHRSRKFLFIRNWIQQTTFYVDGDINNLTEIEFKVSSYDATGEGACNRLKRDDLQQKLSCFNLKLIGH